uniref:Small ribosomal subunit protein uS2c n=1 Tax=Capsosiphon fulvescens TaxID=205396 RepID=A0A3P8MUM8_9CHLO|nr:ribosomal protein S2 [Capsosiphon fulvescens]AWX64098.1 ribosomal protein S2 [Capsosiphon fulvescens]
MTVTLEMMVSAGMHLGHEARKWNPKMKPFIYTQKDNIHIIDLIDTYFRLNQVSKFLTETASQGQTVLFVGTKKQASKLIEKAAISCDSYYVNEKWLGGMLTNWQTIQLSIQKLKDLETRLGHGFLEKLPKKEAALKLKQKQKLEKYLGGMKTMTRLPNVVVIIGQGEEMNAVNECKKLGIRSITVLDTDCDPTLADLFIPANDDSIPSIQLILNTCVDAIQTGKTQSKMMKK